jgi:hypothetical protein
MTDDPSRVPPVPGPSSLNQELAWFPPPVRVTKTFPSSEPT